MNKKSPAVSIVLIIFMLIAFTIVFQSNINLESEDYSKVTEWNNISEDFKGTYNDVKKEDGSLKLTNYELKPVEGVFYNQSYNLDSSHYGIYENCNNNLILGKGNDQVTIVNKEGDVLNSESISAGYSYGVYSNKSSCNTYISDPVHEKVHKYDSNFNELDVKSINGATSSDQIGEDVIYSDGSWKVIYRNNNTVVEYKNNNFSEINNTYNLNNVMGDPTGIYYTSKEKYLITDYNDDKTYLFDSNFNYLNKSYNLEGPGTESIYKNETNKKYWTTVSMSELKIGETEPSYSLHVYDSEKDVNYSSGYFESNKFTGNNITVLETITLSNIETQDFNFSLNIYSNESLKDSIKYSLVDGKHKKEFNLSEGDAYNFRIDIEGIKDSSYLNEVNIKEVKEKDLVNSLFDLNFILKITLILVLISVIVSLPLSK